MVKLCTVCGKVFEAVGNVKRCSLECSIVANKQHAREYAQTQEAKELRRVSGRRYYQSHHCPIIKPCVICGKPFEVKANAKTCGVGCSLQRNKNQKAEYLQRQDVKQKEHDRRQTPHYKELKARNRHTDAYRAQKRNYQSRPEVMARAREYHRAYNILPPRCQNIFALIRLAKTLVELKNKTQ